MRIRAIDSHTGGEPTRVVLDGFPELGGSTMGERRVALQRYWRLCTAIVDEPRGSDVFVGAILTEPEKEGSLAGVLFFNNAGPLGMCGHGTIGVVETLRHMGRIGPGVYRIDTSEGTIQVELNPDASVAIKNVPSYRFQTDVRISTPSLGEIVGDVAYGGNWFFLVWDPQIVIDLDRTHELTETAWEVRRALAKAGITGRDGEEVDHVELFGAPRDSEADSRNFVLCPGGAYDRSPCGTGTSAKLACLLERGDLAQGDWYVQESVTGSRFRGRITREGRDLIPTIVGQAYVIAETTLVFDPEDPLQWGIHS